MALIILDDSDNTRYGTSSSDTIYGLGGSDRLFGLGGADTLYGGQNNDFLQGGAGADRLYGGSGYDTVSYTDSTSGVWIQIGGYGLYGTADGDFIAADVEQVDGSNYGDILMASANGDYLRGNDGNDYLLGGAGYDVLVGGYGNDYLEGGAYVDDLYGGSGTDTVSYASSASGVIASIGYVSQYGDAAGDYIGTDVENLTGSSNSDILYGSDTRNVLSGGGGVDMLVGGGGNDTLIGGAGGDEMYGNADEDTVSYEYAGSAVRVDLYEGEGSYGEAAGDTYDSIENARGSAYNDTFLGSNGDNDFYGLNGRDFMYAAGGRDHLYGGDGDDGLAGEAGNDVLHGDIGHDTIYGGDNEDSVYGGAGNDILYGDNSFVSSFAGADRLTGGDGNDIMHGGGRGDRFIFSQDDLGDVDTIKDFHRSEGDQIYLIGIDANTAQSGNQAFAFIGTAAYTGVAGQLRYVNTGVLTVVAGDVDGDKVSDFRIELTDAPGLIASDFVL
ncbi:calcium-binding protein [Inquilinus sp. NPDC058860]|uniref:calcium-binding protein n=1 Tax=Inquilinus sp. NPDC058860 TaxID=3346652 RepID=UPI0036842B15